MSEYLVTLIPGAGNGTHGLYLMWPKGVGELYEGNIGVAAADHTSRGSLTVLEAGIAVHDVTVGELLDMDNNNTMGEFPRLNHKIGAEEVYNMLITTLFLLFVLTTVALLIFLLMRRPTFCSCCKDPFNQGHVGNGAHSDSTEELQDGITYLSETHGVVTKKRMWDNPPPYESPPDYHSLSPEIIMDAKTLLLNASNTNISTATSKKIHTVTPAGVHTNCQNSASYGRESPPISTTPLVIGTGVSSLSLNNSRDNRKISLQSPPTRPPRQMRKFSSPPSMPPTVVIKPPPHYDTIQDIEHIHIDITYTKS